MNIYFVPLMYSSGVPIIDYNIDISLENFKREYNLVSLNTGKFILGKHIVKVFIQIS